MPKERRGRADCMTCGRADIAVNMDGSLRKHKEPLGSTCDGTTPAPPLLHAEGQDCPVCGHWVYGEECTEDGCGWTVKPPQDDAKDPWTPEAIESLFQGTHRYVDFVGATWEHPGAVDTCEFPGCAPVSDPAPTVDDGFMGPDPKPRRAARTAPDSDDDFMSADPGKKPKKDKAGRRGYYVTDPETGMYRRYKNGNIHPFTRCTTLVKAASDTSTLTDWKQRNTVIGAAKRPDIVMRAHGLTHADDKAELDRIVDELDTVAGAKVAAGHGTDIHNNIERLEGGLITLDQVDPKWRRLVETYLVECERYGLAPVPGLIERTTMTHRYGGVCGTFDGIKYHRPSGTYVMADTKSGQHAENYGRNEVPAQLAVYTEAFNQYGVYDWAEPPEDPDAEWPPGTWVRPLDHLGRPIQVRTDYGVVAHMPIQGADAFTVTLKWVPLDWGRHVAQQCADVRADRSGSPKWVTASPEEIALMLGRVSWDDRFSEVRTKDEATRLWYEVREAGVAPLEVARLVGLAQQSLRRAGVLE